MTELLAPAGGMEALRAAVENGADAVYLGARAFNARQGADNFDGEGLLEAVRHCHLRGVRVHVALNTLVRGDEIAALDRQIEKIAQAAADAVIVQDLGVAASVRKIAPGLELHASTQMAVHNRGGVEFLRDHGFHRAVLAREMSLEEIERCRDLGVELEAFCHGALCVSCSGQCLFSSMLGGRSGNRGMCAQPCRLPYSLEGKRGYLLSTRDLMLADELAAMRDAGVAAFKIEGRLKRAEYVAIATSIYRRALDGEAVTDADREALLQIFNRGNFSRGYLRGTRDAEIIYPERPNHIGALVAEHGRLLRDVSMRDVLAVRRTGAEDLPIALSGRAGDRISERGRIFRLVDEGQMARARESYQVQRRFVDISAKLFLRVGQPMRLEAGGYCVEGEIVQPARKRPFDPARAREQIGKTGGTAYRITEIEIEADERAFASDAQLNALRRQALAGLSETRLKPYEKRAFPADFAPIARPEVQTRLIAQSASPEVLLRALAAGADEIAFAPDDLRISALDRAAEALAGRPFSLVLPQVMGTRTQEKVRAWAHAHSIAATYRSNVGQMSDAWPGDARGAYPLNLLNERAIGESGLARYQPSAELTARQIAALSGEKEIVLWGRIPLMQLRHCPLRAAWALPGCHEDCRRCDGNPSDGAPARLNGLALTDRRGVRFPLRRLASDEGCVVEVLNSVPLFLLRHLGRLPAASGWVLLLSEGEPVEAVAAAHRAALDQEAPDLAPFEGMDTTTGHYFRGVE